MSEALAGKRLDVALAEMLPEHSRSRLQGWIRDGRVTSRGTVLADVKQRLRGNELLLINEDVPEAEQSHAPEVMPLDIVFEDEHLIVLNKPAGLVVHPGSGNWTGTLLNGLLAHSSAAAEIPRAGIVHRLDKETSGLMVVAKTLPAQTHLVRQLQARSVKREYAAVVLGKPQLRGTVDAPIGRHPTHRTKMAVSNNGRHARTHYEVVEQFADAAWVMCSLETGRTHQIRVHMAHIDHPLLGDPVYGNRRSASLAHGLTRQALHAFRLGLEHPCSGQRMQWEVPLAADIVVLMTSLRGDGK
ncbi:MAG: 23S rRNA pseudouridine(1911/1915/1917) synthase RluD [Moraxellaceae bacterium]|nr:23S rRNA pseudouridine(1911/1915/1917) synthase RluD [Moraxellaceae bacterium]